MRLIELTCPRCGASITRGINGRIATCEYCDNQFFIEGEIPGSIPENAQRANEQPKAAAPSSDVPIEQYAEELCKKFLANNDAAVFEDTPKTRIGLGIKNGDTVFLIHDDTLFHSGKNGFAITNRGLYCREIMEKTMFTDWDTLRLSSAPRVDGSCICCGGRKVVYLTGKEGLLHGELLNLYKELYRHVGGEG